MIYEGLLLHRCAKVKAMMETIDKETGEFKKEETYIRKDLYQIHRGEKFALLEGIGGTLHGIYTAIDAPFKVTLKGGRSVCIGVPTNEGIVYSVNTSQYPLEDGHHDQIS